MNQKKKHKYIIEESKGVFVFVDDKRQREKTENTIKIMNQNSNLGYNLLSPHDNKIKNRIIRKGIKNIDNYMSNDYYGDGIQWIFSGYPHDECKLFLTEISFTSNKYNVFGIKPNDNIYDSKKILENYGYKITKEHTYSWIENVYKKNDLYILLITKYDSNKKFSQIKECKLDKNEEQTKIIQIIIEVDTLYLGNMIY